MPIPVRGNTFDPAPEGLHQAVCVDVVADRKEGQWGMREIVRISFQTEGLNPKNGKPYLVVQTFGRNLSVKGRLRPFLKSWRGRDFTPQELEDFDLETLLGANAQLNILHETREGIRYANVAAVMPLPKGVSKLAPRDYVRHVDRQPTAPASDEASMVPNDDDVPF